jgi:aminomethyltransferase
MVPFAGYEMPVQYPMGVMKEHLHTRAAAGLFDVSHMGQVILRGAGAAAALEALVPVDVLGLAEGRQRYGLFTDDGRHPRRPDDRQPGRSPVPGGERRLQGRRHRASARASARDVEVEEVTDRALLALQGPAAEAALARLVPGVAAMRFMDVAVLPGTGGEVWVSRSGYTGEDGFEISVPEARRGLRPRAAGDGGGRADRAGRARFAAAGGGAVPLRPRHRHHHHARSRPG